MTVRPLAVLVALALPAAAGAQSKDLNAKNLEVAALQALHDLGLTPDQLKELANLAKGAAAKQPARTVKVGDKLRKALLDLHAALLQRDDEKIEEARARYDSALEEDEAADLDDRVEPTEEARKRAPRFLKLLTASQVVEFLGGLDVVGPRERLVAALEEIRGLSKEEKEGLRDEVAEEVARLAAGSDADRAKKVRDQAAKLLDRAHGLKDPAFKKQHKQLEAEAAKAVGDVGPLTVLNNALEYGLAELLSNPGLGAAVAAYLK